MREGVWKQVDDGRWAYYGDRPPIFEEPTPLQKMVVRALTFTLIIVVPLGALFLVNRKQTNDRVAANRAAIVRERDVRAEANRDIRGLALHFNRVQEWTAFDNCVADEHQDAIIVSLLLTIPKAQRPAGVQEAIDALEPPPGPEGQPRDRICIPPRGSRPKEAQP